MVLASLPFSTFLGVDDELLLRLVRDEGRDRATEEQHGGEGDPKDVGFRLVVDVDGCRERSKINFKKGVNPIQVKMCLK